MIKWNLMNWHFLLVGYDEMISHRLVSPDHKVQETVFSSGEKAVVNFGDTDYPYEGKLVKAKSFLNE